VGPKKADVIGNWSKLHNEELHNLNFWPDIRMMMSGRSCRMYGKEEKFFQSLGKKRKTK
jgi:hypothetical protein